LNWHIYLLTRSPLALGFVGLTRVVPIIAFSLWGGVVADRYDRRRVMIATQLAMTAVALALSGLTFARRETLWTLYGLNFLSAAAGAFDGPARNSLLPRLVPARELAGALSLNFSAFQAAMIGGPAIAGLILAGHASASPLTPVTSASTSSLALIYFLNAVSFVGVILALATMRTSGAPEKGAGDAHPFEALKEGLRFVFTTPLMVWTMALDFLATFFSGSNVSSAHLCGSGPEGRREGLRNPVAAPAVGALAGSIFVSIRPLPSRQGTIFLASVTAYGAATVVFGFSRNFVLTMAALAFVGLADAISTVIRQTLRQLITPDRLRGRMTSVNAIFFTGGPQLGEMEAGLVASLFVSTAVGVTVSVVSGGLATVLITGLIAAAAPSVRRYDAREYLGGLRQAPPSPVTEPERASTPIGP